MNKKTIAAAAFAGALLTGALPRLALAEDARVVPTEGMVYSTHSNAIGECPALDWHVVVGPNKSLSGFVSQSGMKDIWRVNGTYTGTGDHRFHLDAKEMGGAQRTGTVEGQVQPNGALAMTLGNLSGPSPCADKTVYIRWFRNGNAYDVNNGSAPGGSGGG